MRNIDPSRVVMAHTSFAAARMSSRETIPGVRRSRSRHTCVALETSTVGHRHSSYSSDRTFTREGQTIESFTRGRGERRLQLARPPNLTLCSMVQ